MSNIQINPSQCFLMSKVTKQLVKNTKYQDPQQINEIQCVRWGPRNLSGIIFLLNGHQCIIVYVFNKIDLHKETKKL